jgi:hypothetical protein
MRMMTTTGIVGLITLGAGLAYLLYGIVLAYHWVRFSASWSIAAFSLGSYTIIGLYLLGLMAGAVLMI